MLVDFIEILFDSHFILKANRYIDEKINIKKDQKCDFCQFIIMFDL